jgi:hypothetical protein
VIRRAALVICALLVVVLAGSGCASDLEVDVKMNRDGRGTVSLRLALDPSSLSYLGLDGASPEKVAQRFAPLVADGGWSGDQGQMTVSIDDSGATVSASRTFDTPRQLDEIMSLRRPLASLPPNPSVLAGLPDLPAEVPLLNDFTFRLGTATGDNPGFTLFARGGVGEIGGQTCLGGRAVGNARTLRDGLRIAYRFSLPGGPGSTSAPETPSGANLWRLRFADCPALTATSGGGSSSTLVNGAILAGLVLLLLVVFALRTLRRRRTPAT